MPAKIGKSYYGVLDDVSVNHQSHISTAGVCKDGILERLPMFEEHERHPSQMCIAWLATVELHLLWLGQIT